MTARQRPGYAALAARWLSLARQSGRYDQIRYLDASGRERIRVNFSSGQPYVVPAAELQNKADRYYFRETMALSGGQLYVSAFDLNIEHGQIEQPQKPVIRLATPIVDRQGRPLGMVILNYLGERLLRELRESRADSAGEWMLLDDRGYWLYSEDPADQWDFMLPHRRRFADRYPHLWRLLQAEEAGQMHDGFGLLTFATLFPLRDVAQVLDGGGQPAAVAVGPRRRELVWKIATLVDSPRLNAARWQRVRLGLLRYGLTLAAWGIASAYFARSRIAGLEARERLRVLSSAIEQTTDIVCITDPHGLIQYVNPGFERASGYSAGEVLGRPCSILKSGQHDAAFYQHLWQTVLNGQPFDGVLVNRRKDGVLYYEQKTIAPLTDARGALTSLVSTGKDVTAQMEAQEQLYELAFHDPLTGLPNRALFRDHLQEAMRRATRHASRVGLLFLDLDGFKNVNDSFGHEVGDKLLVQIAERLRKAVRETDTIAHIGGDECTIVLEAVHDAQEIEEIGRKLLGVFTAAFCIDDHEVFVSTSTGAAVFPDDGTDPQQLIKYADTAMYHAKRSGRHRLEFYATPMTAQVATHVALETQLRHAFERGEFALHYQPLIASRTGGLLGVEALLRWQHPERGVLTASEFVGTLEASSLMVPVSHQVLHDACRAGMWLQDQLGLPDLQVSVNVSAGCFSHADIVGAVTQCLKDTGITPGCLILEITESALFHDVRRAAAALHALKALGVRLAIDDFGTGYSSLSYLRRFEFDLLKIDREFICHIAEHGHDAALVNAIITLAHDLGIQGVAEGVETAEQRWLLVEWDCDVLQGFYCGHPCTVEDLVVMKPFSKSV